MTKPRWHVGLERAAARYRQLAQARRTVTPVDPAADTFDFVAGDVEQLVRDLENPAELLTPEDWAAEQEPAIAAGTARRWCRDGELEHIEGPRGYLIPAGAVRRAVVSAEGAFHDVPLVQAS